MPDETPDEIKEPTPSAGDTPPPEDTIVPPEDTEEAATDDEPEALEPTPDQVAAELEALPVSPIHPAAAHGFTEADVDPSKGEYYIGMWADKPNYGCPYCYYSSIEGSGDIELHILSKIDSGDVAHRAYIVVE